MPDVHRPEIRSRNMAAIHAVNTEPELIIRRQLHARGYRYRLHARNLPGSPDIVFRKFSAVIFIHGCFWHRHNCHLFRWPQTRSDFWKNKLNNNAERDQSNQVLLTKTWRIGVIWECALKGKGRIDIEKLADQIEGWLSSDTRKLIITGTLQVNEQLPSVQ